MIVHKVERISTQTHVRLSVFFTTNSNPEEREVYFQYPIEFDDYVVDHVDPFVPLLWVEAMYIGEDIEFKTPVSKQLYQKALDIQETYICWFSELKEVKFKASDLVERTKFEGKNAACFFSSGVDSWFTFLKNKDQKHEHKTDVNHLIIMQGFEHPLAEERNVQNRISSIKNIAGNYEGTKTINGECNWRDVLDADIEYMIGSSLAGAALSLSNRINMYYFASTYNWFDIKNFSTHPYTDEKWINESITVYHDGIETKRVDKVRFCIDKDEDIYLANVCSCMRNRPDSMACGNCYKCIRNITALAILGKLDKATVFDQKFPKKWDKRFISRRCATGYRYVQSEFDFAWENFQLSQELGHPDERVRKFLEEFLSISDQILKKKIKKQRNIPFSTLSIKLHYWKYRFHSWRKPYVRKNISH